VAVVVDVTPTLPPSLVVAAVPVQKSGLDNLSAMSRMFAL
jgi:hypothetical protein